MLTWTVGQSSRLNLSLHGVFVILLDRLRFDRAGVTLRLLYGAGVGQEQILEHAQLLRQKLDFILQVCVLLFQLIHLLQGFLGFSTTALTRFLHGDVVPVTLTTVLIGVVAIQLLLMLMLLLLLLLDLKLAGGYSLTTPLT